MTQFNAGWFFPLWLVSLACGVGLLIFAGLPWFSTIFFPLGYLALLCALFTTIRFWHDWLNPLSLIVLVGFIRFTIAGILLCFTEPDMPIFHVMGLQSEHWLYGHALALIGLLSTTVGWFIIECTDDTRFFQKPIRLTPELSGGTLYAAIVGMSVGLLALFVFIKSNTSISITEIASTGIFRSTQIQEGTGKFFFLSFMLISSSVVFVDYLFSRKHAWWIALLPAIVAMMALFVLGGRLRSLTAMAAGLLVFRAHRENAKTSLRTIICFVSIAVLLPIVFAAGAAYRGGQGIEGAQQTLSMSSILAYIQYSVWVDFGHLHALAAAVVIGPGVLEGRTFLALLWPLGKIVALPGKSASVLMAEMLVGLGDRKWGFHATLIGDAYLNFGLIGVIVVTVIFAMILKIIYIGFRERLICNAWYALSVVYSLTIFFESVEKYGEALTILVFVFATIKIGQVFSEIALAKESP
jgi:oligosaccharide repeat unit polymerase